MTGKEMCNRAPIVPFNTMAMAIITFPTAIAERACLHERPTANMELAICQVVGFAASEIQYAI
jgi:hypothetical protein